MSDKHALLYLLLRELPLDRWDAKARKLWLDAFTLSLDLII